MQNESSGKGRSAVPADAIMDEKGQYIVSCIMCDNSTKIDENLYKFNHETLISFSNGRTEQMYTCFNCTMQHANALKEDSFFCDYCKYHLTVDGGIFKQGDKFLCSVCCGCDACKKWHLTSSGRTQCAAVTADAIKHKKTGSADSLWGRAPVASKKRVHKESAASSAKVIAKAVKREPVDSSDGVVPNKKRVQKRDDASLAKVTASVVKREPASGGVAPDKFGGCSFQFAFRMDDMPVVNQGTACAVIVSARNSLSLTQASRVAFAAELTTSFASAPELLANEPNAFGRVY